MFVQNICTEFRWLAFSFANTNRTGHGNIVLLDMFLREIFPNLAQGRFIEVSYPLGVFDSEQWLIYDGGSNVEHRENAASNLVNVYWSPSPLSLSFSFSGGNTSQT